MLHLLEIMPIVWKCVMKTKIYGDGEFVGTTTIRKFRIVQTEGSRRWGVKSSIGKRTYGIDQKIYDQVVQIAILI